jgi:hypothetical protein
MAPVVTARPVKPRLRSLLFKQLCYRRGKRLPSKQIRETLSWQPRFDDLSTIVGHALAWERELTAHRINQFSECSEFEINSEPRSISPKDGRTAPVGQFAKDRRPGC